MLKKKKKISPLLGQVLQKIAPRIGARVTIEPRWGIVGQIAFRNGRKRYFRYSSIDLNTLGAAEIAKDKGYAKFFMAQMGYPVVKGRDFYSTRWAKAIGSKDDIHAAYRYAQKIGLPVIVKPNSGSQGVGVMLVHTKREFYDALRRIFVRDRVALVEECVPGKDYRIVVLDSKIISAYERLPLSIVGDGISTVGELLKTKQQNFVAASRDTRLKLDDPRIQLKLARKKLNFASVLANGEHIFLLDNANLSSGGDSVDVTSQVHPGFKKIAIQLTHDMGLRMCGVDLMVNGDISEAPKQYWVIEINAAPGLDHYARSGAAQEKIVEELYLKVLKSMEKEK